MWTIILRTVTRLTGFIQRKAAMEQRRKVMISNRRGTQTSQTLKQSSDNSESIKVPQGGQAGYPVHQQNVKLPVEIWQRRDLNAGQDERLVIEPAAQTPLPTPPKPKRSDLCFQEADKNRANGDDWLAEINDMVGVVNRRMERQSSGDIQAHANKQLDKYLEAIEAKRVINPKELEDTDG